MDLTLSGSNVSKEAQKYHSWNSIITWAGKYAGLFQSDLLVSIDSQLQAAAQLLIYLTALAIAGAVRHKAGKVSVAHAVSTHHTLSDVKEEDDELPQ